MGNNVIVWNTSRTCSNGVCITKPYSAGSFSSHTDLTGTKRTIVSGSINLGTKPVLLGAPFLARLLREKWGLWESSISPSTRKNLDSQIFRKTTSVVYAAGFFRVLFPAADVSGARGIDAVTSVPVPLD